MSAVSENPVHVSTGKVEPDPSPTAPLPSAELYEVALRGLDNPFVQFLKKVHGVVPTDTTVPVTGNGIPIVSRYDAAVPNSPKHPFFKDDWTGAFAYRHRPTEQATVEDRIDPTLESVLKKAEGWVLVLYKAMMNVEGCNNKPDSNEINIFKSEKLDKKSVEASCRAVLVSLLFHIVLPPLFLTAMLGSARPPSRRRILRSPGQEPGRAQRSQVELQGAVARCGSGSEGTCHPLGPSYVSFPPS